jgi:threonyl-tRNA synthetase
MNTIRVVLPDGSGKDLPEGSSALALAECIGPRLAKEALAASIDGEPKDLATPLHDGARVSILTFDSEEGRTVFRHSASHVMASAIQRLRPDVKLAIGPSIEDGFYYDLELPEPFTEADFASIEAEMAKVKVLAASGRADIYILMTNATVTGTLTVMPPRTS